MTILVCLQYFCFYFLLCSTYDLMFLSIIHSLGFPGGSDSKVTVRYARDPGSIPGWEDPLEKEMATHSSILAWKIPWKEEPGEL